jgi:hypothetical protein
MLEEREARGIALDHDHAEGRFELMDRAREALREEAQELCDHASDGMDFRSEPRPVAASAPRIEQGDDEGDDASRDARAVDAVAIVRHRFDRPDRDGRTRVTRRVVTLRDRRMGRAPSTRHGSDPPA